MIVLVAQAREALRLLRDIEYLLREINRKMGAGGS